MRKTILICDHCGKEVPQLHRTSQIFKTLEGWREFEVCLSCYYKLPDGFRYLREGK